MEILQVEYKRSDGVLTQVNTFDREWKQMNHLELSKGDSVGGHYHMKKDELFYVLRGEVSVLVRDQLRVDSLTFKKGGCFIIEALEEHTISALKDSTLIELLSEPYDKEDTHTYD